MKRVALIGLAVGLAIAAPARAQETPIHDDAAHERTVRVEVVGGPELAARVGADANALLGPAGLVVEADAIPHLDAARVLERPAPPFHRARIVVDLGRGDSAWLVVADDRRGRISVRRFPRAADDEDLVLEAMLQVAHSLVGAIVRGAEFGDDRETAERVLAARRQRRETLPAPPDAPVSEREPDELDVAALLAYELSLVDAAPRFAHGPRASAIVLVGAGAPAGLVLSLDVGYRVGPELDRGGVRGRLDSVPARLSAGILLEGDPIRVAARLGLGVDVVLPWVSADAPLAVRSSVSVDFAVVLALRFELALDGDVALFLELGADGYPTLVRYSAYDVERVVVLEPLPVRPHAALGVRFL